ncbi:MAG: succinate dehydrogenase/fumarate reductase iron-sulfur subunit [Methanomassiliicoccales archaeon]|nr:succinate dehydrogenase/fumarate reductase iron-sulfur subunit [Methanomassiliicoccales archaeon]
MTDVRVRILRSDPQAGEASHFETYTLPRSEGMRVLDLLRYVHENVDGTLSFRHLCRSGQCGTCAVMVNGIPRLACKTTVPYGAEEVVLEPLRNFPVVKDLVIDSEMGRMTPGTIATHLKRAFPVVRPEVIRPGEIVDLRALRSCIGCGSCVAACPVVDAIAAEFEGPTILRRLSELSQDRRDTLSRTATALASGLYDCTTCESCWKVCPQDIRLPEKAIGKLRSAAVSEGCGPLPAHKVLTKSIKNYWNPWMAPRSQKADWAKAFSLPPAGRNLFFAGCSASLLRKGIAASSVRCLLAVGEEVAHLGRDEPCCLSPALRVGDDATFDRLARKNIELVRRSGAERLIVTCAGCYKTWKEDYPRRCGDLGFEVVHISEVLDSALADGRLKMRDEPANHIDIAYHDPCHLGRAMGIYEAPRRVLAAVPGLSLLEMEMNRENALCCGSGGGVKTAKPSLSLAIGARRLLMAERAGAHQIASCCPWCEQNMDDCQEAAAALWNRSIDMVEIVARALEE